jgi:hypothetical protein
MPTMPPTPIIAMSVVTFTLHFWSCTPLIVGSQPRSVSGSANAFSRSHAATLLCERNCHAAAKMPARARMVAFTRSVGLSLWRPSMTIAAALPSGNG